MKTFACVIVVLDKGFVYHGDLLIQDDGWFLLEKANNIRKFGTTRGLGQLAINGPTRETVLDPCLGIRGTTSAIVHVLECDADKWK